MSKVNELMEKRAAIIAGARKELDKATENGVEFSAESQIAFDRAMVDADAIKKQVDNFKRLNAIDETKEIINEAIKFSNDNVKPNATRSYEVAFDAWLRKGAKGLSQEQSFALVTNALDGSNIVAQEYERRIVEKLNETSWMRQVCPVIQTQNDRHIAVQGAGITATIIDEAAAIPEVTPHFNRVTLKAWGLKAYTTYSWEITNDALFDLPGELGRVFGTAFGEAENKFYLTGTGVGQPMGVMTAAPVGKEIATITADSMIDTLFSLPMQYRQKAIWGVSDVLASQLAKLKDNTGQYIYLISLRDDTPDKLLGKSVYTSTAIPAPTSGQPAAVIFNPDYYMIADRGQMMIRNTDVNALNGLNTIVAIKRFDGQLLLPDAARTLKVS